MSQQRGASQPVGPPNITFVGCSINGGQAVPCTENMPVPASSSLVFNGEIFDDTNPQVSGNGQTVGATVTGDKDWTANGGLTMPDQSNISVVIRAFGDASSSTLTVVTS
jgi:hypothetical protein